MGLYALCMSQIIKTYWINTLNTCELFEGHHARRKTNACHVSDTKTSEGALNTTKRVAACFGWVVLVSACGWERQHRIVLRDVRSVGSKWSALSTWSQTTARRWHMMAYIASCVTKRRAPAASSWIGAESVLVDFRCLAVANWTDSTANTCYIFVRHHLWINVEQYTIYCKHNQLSYFKHTTQTFRCEIYSCHNCTYTRTPLSLLGYNAVYIGKQLTRFSRSWVQPSSA